MNDFSIGHSFDSSQFQWQPEPEPYRAPEPAFDAPEVLQDTAGSGEPVFDVFEPSIAQKPDPGLSELPNPFDLVGEITDFGSTGLGLRRAAVGLATADMPAILGETVKTVGESLDRKIDALGNVGRAAALGKIVLGETPVADATKLLAGELIDKVLELRHEKEVLGAATVGGRLAAFGKTSAIGYAAEHVVSGIVDGIADAPSLNYERDLSLNEMLAQNARTEASRLRAELRKASMFEVPGVLIEGAYHAIVADLTAAGTAAYRQGEQLFEQVASAR